MYTYAYKYTHAHNITCRIYANNTPTKPDTTIDVLSLVEYNNVLLYNYNLIIFLIQHVYCIRHTLRIIAGHNVYNEHIERIRYSHYISISEYVMT